MARAEENGYVGRVEEGCGRRANTIVVVSRSLYRRRVVASLLMMRLYSLVLEVFSSGQSMRMVYFEHISKIQSIIPLLSSPLIWLLFAVCRSKHARRHSHLSCHCQTLLLQTSTGISFLSFSLSLSLSLS